MGGSTGVGHVFNAIVPVDVLQSALDPVSALVDECRINLNEDGLHIAAADPANVGLVKMSLDASAFESYTADGGVIGVNLETLEDVLSMGDGGDLVHLDLNEETRKLDIRIGGLSYTAALIDPDSVRGEPDIPDLDLNAKVVVEGSDLDRGITACDLVSDHITLRADEDSEAFYFEAEGDTDDVDLQLGNDDLLSARVNGDAESLFSLDYLKDMSGPIGSDSAVSIRIGDEFPTKLDYSLSNGHVEVQNLLAPRIQSD